jgi:uncharacterized phage infection (PIP) family protein YhgE
MGTPRSADELLYDSAATLRLVDNVLDDLRVSPAPASTPSGIAEIPLLLLKAYAEINSVLESLRQSRDTLQRATVEKLQSTNTKLAEVTSATEVAATDIMDGVDRALALVDTLDAEAESGAASEAATEARGQLRDELFNMMGCLQFQDITTQQLNYASSVLVDMESRLARLMQIIDPDALGLPAAVTISEPTIHTTFDPAATTADAEVRQALVDQIFSR